MPLGGLIAIAALLPNLLVVFFPPTAQPVEQAAADRRVRLMEALERLGQVGTFVIPFFYPIDLRQAPVVPAVMGLALAFYYTGWARYVLRGHRYSMLFRPLLGVPLPMAVAPVVYFLAAAVLLHSWYLGAAVVLLAAGHLYVSGLEWRRCVAIT